LVVLISRVISPTSAGLTRSVLLSTTRSERDLLDGLVLHTLGHDVSRCVLWAHSVRRLLTTAIASVNVGRTRARCSGP
jgi:hypothetical protein